MLRKNFPVEMVYQVFSLLIIFILIHGLYVSLIRPRADVFLAQQQARLEQQPDAVQEQNFYVIIRDYEQEACLILFVWALAILGFKGVLVWRQQVQLDQDLLQLPVNMPIGPEDTRELLRRLNDLPGPNRQRLLPTALLTATQRFAATRNIQDAATAVRVCCDTHGERLDSELSIIRYVAWAIPSVGFIGTVRGIGAALSQAHRAVEGDITGVTQSLGVAFNSTFIALVLSIILMFFIHQLQLRQERLILDTDTYCQENLINKLRIKPTP
ncbi:MAG: MotA/TolQ/ExbB proton channel family protein [Deltaproteobacteria bacterium]|jgi:biopolymer transport protein ExbB/TolQ|nr:MotA/TolQ/ExbB proton channel family protein [Deltaproteobacteria bacterium]